MDLPSIDVSPFVATGIFCGVYFFRVEAAPLVVVLESIGLVTSPHILWDIAVDTHNAVTIPWDIPSYKDIACSPWDIACLPWDVAMGHRHTYCGMSLSIHRVHCPQAMSTRSRTISCLIKPCPFES